MYTSEAFVETDLKRLDALAWGNPFITLVTVEGGAPIATHVPVLYRRNGSAVELEGHWARPNPQAGGAVEALAIVQGPDTYISPGWYPDKEAAARVPTWNYVAAHLHGRLERYDDEEALGSLVARLGDRLEPTVGGDWQYDHARPELRSQLRGIIGFRFIASRIEMKSKLSQNHPDANRRAVVAALEAQEAPGARAIADLMRNANPLEE